jgi:biotin carboxyl carrier protein
VRRHRRALPLVVGTVAAGTVAIAVIGASTTASSTRAEAPSTRAEAPPTRTEAPPTRADAPPAADPEPASTGAPTTGSATSEVDPEPLTPPLARLGELALWSPGEDPVVVGFHEAAHVSAEPVVPIGVLIEDHNTTRTDLPADDPTGVEYLVMSSRGRAAGPTSAIDVVLEEGSLVRAPVTGTVLDVREYVLYGGHEDLRIELVPDGRPDLRLVIIHVDGAQVEVGDRVVGGVTPVASTARALPFTSHIDRETEPDRHPHVHLELQPIDRPRPGDERDAADGSDRD